MQGIKSEITPFAGSNRILFFDFLAKVVCAVSGFVNGSRGVPNEIKLYIILTHILFLSDEVLHKFWPALF